MTTQQMRKGASRATDIPPDVLAALSRGDIPTMTLTECMALDQSVLARTVLPHVSASTLAEIDAACTLGILKRMMRIGEILWEELGEAGIRQCQQHRADMVRGWACFMIGARQTMSMAARLDAIAPLADDPHFGVREWAWMAVRVHLVKELDAAIDALTLWTAHPSAYLRRFASEALRPRGVWCTHIALLKQSPQRALPILAALSADESVYVQDSVANWLNDAGKDQPDWVRGVCAAWLAASPAAATQRICQRAMRHLSSQEHIQ